MRQDERESVGGADGSDDEHQTSTPENIEKDDNTYGPTETLIRGAEEKPLNSVDSITTMKCESAAKDRITPEDAITKNENIPRNSSNAGEEVNDVLFKNNEEDLSLSQSQNGSKWKNWCEFAKKELKPDKRLIPLKIFAFLFYGGKNLLTYFLLL